MTIKTYIEHRDGGYWIEGSRVSLDSVIHAFRDGQSPEGIAHAFTALRLEQIYGAVASYLANQEELDAYLAEARASYERQADLAWRADPAFYEKLETARNRQPA